MQVQPDNLPAKLRETGLFCCWRYEERGGRRTKVPYNPRTGGGAQSTNPATFAPLSVALNAAQHGAYSGIGVGIFGQLGAIDIDHCVDEDGVLSDMAMDIISIMQGYTEYSPSGKGMRILFLADGFLYDKERYYINNQTAGLEVYIAGCTNKYVTVTGNALTPGYDLEERGENLRTVLEKYMLRPEKKIARQPPGRPKNSVDVDDTQLIELAKNAQNGEAFRRLWAGDISDYQSHSEADIALCNMLAFWTNRDDARMDRLFRQSGLMREKWDRATAGSTYGAITIQQALNSCSEGYDPHAFFQKTAGHFTSQTGGETVTLADLHPENNRRYGWHDIGNGNLFADWFKNKARYVPERKKWFVYDSGSWQADVGDLKVMEMCKALADNLVVYALSLEDEQKRQEYLKFVGKWQRRNYRETILKDAASVYPVSIDRFDQNKYLFNCENGTLNLQTGEFYSHSSEDFCSMKAAVCYDQNAKSLLWEKTVKDVMQDDAEKASFLQKAMGYGLTGDTSEECFFILYGPTARNGKGTIMETYIRLLGGYGRTSKPDTIAQKQSVNGNGPSEDIARLAGARVVNISEPGKQMVLSAALVKTLTGGDTVTARYLNENSFEFVPQFKLFINTNHLPKVTDVTVFSSGRVKVIPFEKHFTEEERDKDLKQKLAQPENLSGILNWCLEGLWLFRETGLSLPSTVLAATLQYQRDSDKIGRFIDEMLEASIGDEVRTEDAYRAYQEWCTRNGLAAEGMPVWKRAMGTYTEIKKKRPNGAGRTVSPQSLICNIKWK